VLEVRRAASPARSPAEARRPADAVVPIARQIATRLLCDGSGDQHRDADLAPVRDPVREGITVIATSNRKPDGLYKTACSAIASSLHRPDQAAAGVLGRAAITTIASTAAGFDVYRRRSARATPARRSFRALSGGADGEPRVLRTQGRDVDVPRAAPGVAMAHYLDWCARPMGAADFLCIADHFHTVIMADIQKMGPDSRDKAARFVTMIDTFYEKKVKFICSAASAPVGLCVEGDGAFEFERTVSRLMEMQSPEYLALEHIA
jgi:cell division protein ZapE